MEFESQQMTDVPSSTDEALRAEATARRKTITPLTTDIAADELSESEIAVKHETAGALSNIDSDTEVTTRDEVETFSSKDSAAMMKLLVVGLGILFVTVFGYIGFLLTR